MSALLGTTEQKLACLKISAQMNKRMNAEDPIPSAEDLIEYAAKLTEYVRTGWKETSHSG